MNIILVRGPSAKGEEFINTTFIDLKNGKRRMASSRKDIITRKYSISSPETFRLLIKKIFTGVFDGFN